MAEGTKYVVRGAKMNCTCGSHPRKINLPVSHGAYVNGKPMMNEADNKAIVNIAYFGVCTSGENPNSETLNLIKETGQTVTGKRCCPKFIGKWDKTKENTKVEGKAALTMESQLTCAFHGKITFANDGQSEK